MYTYTYIHTHTDTHTHTHIHTYIHTYIVNTYTNTYTYTYTRISPAVGLATQNTKRLQPGCYNVGVRGKKKRERICRELHFEE